MNKLKHLLSLLSLVSCLLSAQEVLVIDELGSPIKEVHLVNRLGDVHAFTDKNGLADLSVFDANETINISHSGFLSLSLSKSIITSFDNQITLIFDSETIGEVILLTRIDDENLKTTADRRVILHSKEIERLNTQNTADLLEKRAGINVQKSQMGGGSPVIRGFEANRILLVVDGVRLNNAIYRGGHLQNIISIDNASLEQVDIIFGPSSSEYGSDALGGIIHLKTKRPKFSEKPKFSHSYSTRYATANKGISKHYDMQYTGADFALFSSFSHSDFDDLRMGSYRSHGFSDWGKVYHFIEDGVQQENADPNIQQNTGYSQTDFMQKVILKIDPQWTLTGNFQYSNSSNIPRFDKLNDYKTVEYDSLNNQTIYSGLKYGSWNYGPQKRYFSSIQLDHSAHNFLMDSAQLIFAYQDVYESRHVQKIGFEESINRYEEVDIYSFNANFRKNKLRYGLEYYSNSVYSKANLHSSQLISPYEQTRYPNGGSSMSSLAGYLTYSKSFGEQLKLHSGLRYTQNELKALFHNTRTWTLPYDSIGYKYKALTGNLSIAYHPNESWKIAAIASTGFHAPNIDDTGKLFIKSKILTIPNFNLAPEFAKTIELNITKNINNRILINANAYYTLIDDAIMRVDADTNDYNGFVIDPDEDFLYIKTNKNTGKAEIFGATASISMRIASNYTLESDYTYIKGRNIKNDLPFTHIPPSFGKTAFYADYDNWRASFFVLYNGRKAIEEYDIESGTDNEEESPIEWVLHEESNSMIIEYQGTPAWYTLNMSAMHRFSDSFTVQLALENILDSHYKTFASGLSAPGRNFILTLRAKF
jgi:hemoglobin/transferrin/lactoferrin receptor protein